MDSNNHLSREQLELVVQKKKLNEVYGWFRSHFFDTPQAEYSARCPFVVIQGPTGCGKTSTLKCIAHELRIPIKEYNEAIDTTVINYDTSKRTFGNDATNSDNLSRVIDQRKARRFEEFVVDSLMYNINYLGPDKSIDNMPREDDEFDSDDDFPILLPSNQQKPPDTTRKQNPARPTSALIIHIESSLNFARSQRILIQTVCKLMKIFKDLSRRQNRRIAIVFETLDCDGDSFSIPNKMKVSLGMQVFKFNPVTKGNMKKLVESLLKNFALDDKVVESIVNDSDGDIRACINSIQFLRNKSKNMGDTLDCNGLSNRSMNPSLGSFGNGSHNQNSLFSLPVSKRQKINHGKVKKFELNSSLMRDTTRSLGFFHVLGKIFYQKRLYPLDSRPPHRSLDRPYPTENSTEYIVDMLDVEAKKLKAWLHQHYYKFCHDSSIEKAASFLDNLSTIDTISIESTQSSQFYETHKSLEPIQVHTAIEATVYSLYQDQSSVTKASHKRTQTADGMRIIKTSVENVSNNGELYSFNKPASMALTNLVDDYKKLLAECTCNLVEESSARYDSTQILVDYVPYLNHMTRSQSIVNPSKSQPGPHKPSGTERLPPNSLPGNRSHPTVLWVRDNTIRIIESLSAIEIDPKMDFDTRHEKLLEAIEELISSSSITTVYDGSR